MSTLKYFSLVFFCIAIFVGPSKFLVLANAPPKGLEVIFAINAGGPMHRDVNGIVYEADPSNEGIASDFGLRMDIDRVHPHDEILYQTERYSPSSFGYDISVKDDGAYVLVLKFSEVYFRSPGGKIFNVLLNNQHLVIKDLDIYAHVGYAAAHDEIIPFIVTDFGKKLIVGTTSSVIRRSRIRLDFVRGAADNPKVNAFYVAKGSPESVPKLPPHRHEMEEDGEEEEEDEEEDELFYGDDEEDIQFSKSDLGYENQRVSTSVKGNVAGRKRLNVRSGPPVDDPWDDEPIYVVYSPLAAAIFASIVSFFFLRLANKKL